MKSHKSKSTVDSTVPSVVEVECPQLVDSSEASIKEWWDEDFGYCSDGVLFHPATSDDMPQYARFVCHRRTYWLTLKNLQ